MCPFLSGFFQLAYWFFLKKFFKDFILRERGKERERERNTNVWLPITRPPLQTWPATQACALDWESNQRPFGSQDGTQSTEPHQLGQLSVFKIHLL